MGVLKVLEANHWLKRCRIHVDICGCGRGRRGWGERKEVVVGWTFEWQEHSFFWALVGLFYHQVCHFICLHIDSNWIVNCIHKLICPALVRLVFSMMFLFHHIFSCLFEDVFVASFRNRRNRLRCQVKTSTPHTRLSEVYLLLTRGEALPAWQTVSPM